MTQLIPLGSSDLSPTKLWNQTWQVRLALLWFVSLLLLATGSLLRPAQGSLSALACFGAYDLLLCLLGSLLLSGVVGATLGALAGLSNDAADRAISRLFEVFGALPVVILALVMAAAAPRTTFPLVLALGLTRWVEIARLVRSQVRRARAQDYITAARALGLGRWAVLRHHIAPNAAGPVVVALSFSASGLVSLRMLVAFVLPETTTPSNWGAALRLWHPGASSWLHFALPATFLVLTQLSQNAVAEALRGALDSNEQAR